MEIQSNFLPPRKFVNKWQRWAFLVSTPGLVLMTWIYVVAFSIITILIYNKVSYEIWYSGAEKYNDAEMIDIIDNGNGQRQIRVAYPKKGSKFVFEEGNIDVGRSLLDFARGTFVRVAVGRDGTILLAEGYSGLSSIVIILFGLSTLLALPSQWARLGLKQRKQALALLEQGLLAEATLVPSEPAMSVSTKHKQANTYTFKAYNDNDYSVKKIAPNQSEATNEILVLYELRTPERPTILAEIESAPTLTEAGMLQYKASKATILTFLGVLLATAVGLGIYFWI